MTSSSQLKPLNGAKSPSVRQHVTDALRSAVISGELQPGEVYSAPSLANRFGVSATPVREAMMELQNEGMVVALRNSGFRVIQLSDRELDEVAELRIMIEAPAMGTIAARCEGPIAEAVEGLRPLAERLNELAQGGDIVEYLNADMEFHSRFLAILGNETLVETIVRLRRRSRLYGLENLQQSGHLVGSTAEHSHMIDLAMARDEQGLRLLTQKHISHVRTDWAKPIS